MWAGLFILNMDTVNKDIDFSICSVGERTDSGGATYYFLKNNKYKKVYLRFCHLADANNGNITADINGCSGLMTIDSQSAPIKLYPHERRPKNIYSEYRTHLDFIKKYNFPKPYIFDLIKRESEKDYFLFHFKNANWGSQYNMDNHMVNKKQAMYNMLLDLGVENG